MKPSIGLMEKRNLILSGPGRSFGNTCAVAGVRLTIGAGEFVGIIGRPGARKSPLLRLVNRLIGPTDGRIAFGGHMVTALMGKALRDWRRPCAMIFPQSNLIDRH